MRDYATISKRLRQYSENCVAYKLNADFADAVSDAADAIEELLGQHEADAKEISWLKKCVQDLPKPPRWISVEERLPEDQGDDARAARGGDYIHKVLAASVTPNYTVMDTAYLENGIWSLSQYTSWKQIIGAPVTHWMPLPEPPKEDDDA